MNTTTYHDGRKPEILFFSSLADAEAAAKVQVVQPGVRSVKTRRIGRNEPCPCGSGKKFKKCCINRIAK